MEHENSSHNSDGVGAKVRSGLIVLRRLVIFFGLIAFFATLWFQSSDAQETVSDSLTASEVPKIEIITRPKENVNLSEGIPTPVKLKLDNVPGAKSDLAEGVIVNGYARYVNVGDEIIGQLMLTGLEKGDAKEPLNENNFTGQFVMNGPEFKTVETFSVDGDQYELVAALQALQEKTKIAEPAPEEEKEVVDIQDDGPAQTGNETSGNDIAAGYSTPEAIKPTAEAKTTVSTTRDGCSIRVDEAQGVAIVQSKVQTFKDGVLESEEACSDELVRYPLEKSYSLCTDVVDMTAMTATAQYQLYFVDDSLARTDVSTCAPDTETVFNIVESFEGCSIFLDYAGMTAVPRSSLVYSNASNVEVEVRSCANSETKPAAPLTQTTATCSIRHDFAANKSMSQSIWTYQQDGVNYQAGTCTDDGTEYTHTKSYKDDVNNYICSKTVNFSTNQVTLQSRTYITVNGLKEYITECTPDTSSIGVQVTTLGCTDPNSWTHDITAEQTYSHERYFYEDSGETIYVTECQASTTTYPHLVETSSWENHDDQRYAYQLSNIYIDAPSGKFYVATNTIIAGTVQMPYTLQSQSEVQNGQVEYTGCDAVKQTDEVKIWARPDGTAYNQVIGAGTPIGPVFVCTVTAAPYWKLVSSSNSYSRDTYSATCSYTSNGGDTRYRTQTSRGRNRTTATYEGHRPVSREDGLNFEQISTTTYTLNLDVGSRGYCNAGHWSDYNQQTNDYQTATATLFNQSSWDTAQGW